ncbi:MAG: hypothetical protein KKF44_06950 [Nanoarchaeota archaeon]|nr:hypothetical protein [Nanoarchaeota archaeon]
MNKEFKKELLVILLISVTLIISCTTQETEKITDNTNNKELESNQKIITVNKIEVYHFHATQQCWSCKTVGEFAEETVNTYFREEVNNGKIEFKSINIDEFENKAVSIKYGATGSSLFLGVYDENGFHPEQNTLVWYKLQDKEDFQNYLKGVIEKRFAGEFE